MCEPKNRRSTTMKRAVKPNQGPFNCRRMECLSETTSWNVVSLHVSLRVEGHCRTHCSSSRRSRISMHVCLISKSNSNKRKAEISRAGTTLSSHFNPQTHCLCMQSFLKWIQLDILDFVVSCWPNSTNRSGKIFITRPPTYGDAGHRVREADGTRGNGGYICIITRKSIIQHAAKHVAGFNYLF